MINTELAKQLNLSSETISKIESLHEKRNNIFKLMEENKDNKTRIMELYTEWEESEFALQELWGFEKNANFHRFFEIPICSCPFYDNLDRIGTPYRVYSEDCIIHGREVK